jgi:hypothetical protein
VSEKHSRVGFEDRNMLMSCENVELRGFDPRTSCMPSAGSTSTHVHLRRSPSWNVHPRPYRSGPVAALRAVLPRASTNVRARGGVSSLYPSEVSPQILRRAQRDLTPDPTTGTAPAPMAPVRVWGLPRNPAYAGRAVVGKTMAVHEVRAEPQSTVGDAARRDQSR